MDILADAVVLVSESISFLALGAFDTLTGVHYRSFCGKGRHPN